jgi:eukaryotic-like serine/threonine-protein kinase
LGGCALETHRITQNLDPQNNTGSDEQLRSGTILENRYLIEGMLGVGGMSSVYRARDTRFTAVKPVAIKEMTNRANEEMVRNTIVSNFEREANILATLSHPAIPKIYDYFTIETHSYLVMELIQGNNLEVVINQTQGYLPENQVINWAIVLCDVLHYLHTHEPSPIIFRDMKPANIVVKPDNSLVLVDFGIAKTFQAGQKGTMIGTEGYSPPEQYRGEATPMVDIYALGASLHHVLTRRDPRIETPFTFSERAVTACNPNISAELETIVNTAVQYNAADRFKDTATMKEALIVVARKTGALNMETSTMTAAISETQDIKPLWSFECEDEIRGTATFNDGMIFVGAYDNNVYGLNAATGEFIWKYAAEGGVVSTPAIFENTLVFGSEDHKIHVVSTRSGRISWTYYSEGPIRSSPLVEDRHIFVGSDDGNLHIVNAITGRRALKIDLGAPIRSTPMIVNENVYVGTENGEFFSVDFRGKINWRVRAKRAITSSPKILNDVVYFGSVDGLIYAIDANTGWTIWRFRMNKGTVSSPSIHENSLYIGSADGNIYSIDTRSSKENWRFATEHQVSSSPIFYKNSVYCGGVDGNLYCLDAKTGRLRWKFITESAITSSPVIQDDIVYIGSTDHKLYALPT